MISIRYIKLFSVLLLLGTVSCKSVYYNTYFNAQKQYRLADLKRLESEIPGSRITPAVYNQIYMAVIKKASAVIELHPKSKWVDDSILMIGKSFYWRGGYSDALTKFQEMQENFPQSALIPETLYWQGLTYWAAGQLNEARLSFARVSDREDANLQAKARLALAEIEVAEENYEDAIEAYQDLRNTLKKTHSLQAQAWQGIGNGHFHLRHYNKALEAYQQALKSRPSRKINFETRTRMGEVLELQGKLGEAQEVYKRILKIKRLKIYTPEVRIKQANLYTLSDQHEAALESYEKIAKNNPRTRYSAEAYYRMGLIEQKYRKDLNQAKDYFNKASREKRSSDAAIQAIQRGKDLSALERYIKQIEREKGGKRSLPPMFEMAGLYLFRLGELDSALVTYRRALTVADTVDISYAPKALFSIGVIQADSLENQTEAEETFRKLIDTYPLTDYAVEARKRIQHNRTDDALAEARFLEAENLQLEGAPPQDYLTILEQVAEEYPQSLYAPKALYSLAWSYENRLHQLDVAKGHYQKVIDQYPQTPFAAIAIQKLKGKFLEPPDIEKEKPPVQAVKNPVTPAPTPAAKDIPTTPQPKEYVPDFEPIVRMKITPKYSEEARDEVLAEGLDGTMVIRLLVDISGRVKKANVVSGPEILEDEAIKAALRYSFSPAQKDGKPMQTWTEISIPFN